MTLRVAQVVPLASRASPTFWRRKWKSVETRIFPFPSFTFATHLKEKAFWAFCYSVIFTNKKEKDGTLGASSSELHKNFMAFRGCGQLPTGKIFQNWIASQRCQPKRPVGLRLHQVLLAGRSSPSEKSRKGKVTEEAQWRKSLCQERDGKQNRSQWIWSFTGRGQSERCVATEDWAFAPESHFFRFVKYLRLRI